MKLLTFLGVAKYEETTYTWQDLEHKCCYAPIASCSFLHPDKLIIFLTEDAEEQVFPAFKAACPKTLEIQTVPVPLGKDERQLWQIFNQVSSAVQPGEEVAFDITHGLRSFPLVGLLAAAFLRSGLDINLKAVMYGAYDVRDKTTGRTPMFDLSPMLALLDWAAAADRFNRTGDSRYLGSLLKAQKKQLALDAEGNPDLLEQTGQLGKLAGALSNISQSLHLVRPHQAMESIANLPERTAKAEAALQRSAPALPFSLLLDSIVKSYQPLGQPDSREPSHVIRTLEIERAMIHWYTERELWMQAVSLAREWLLSWVMIRLGVTQVTQLAARQRIESVLGAEANDYVLAKENELPFIPVFFAQLPQASTVLGLWPRLAGVRNDIDHAGMRENAASHDDLIAQIQSFLILLDSLTLA